jgi:hypothetical protein
MDVTAFYFICLCIGSPTNLLMNRNVHTDVNTDSNFLYTKLNISSRFQWHPCCQHDSSWHHLLLQFSTFEFPNVAIYLDAAN